MPEPPFKTPLKPSGHGFIFDDDNDHIMKIHGRDLAQKQSRRDWIIMCVNAFPDLVAVAKRFRNECAQQIRIADGDENMIYAYAQDVAFIDAALAEFPCDLEKLEATIVDNDSGIPY